MNAFSNQQSNHYWFKFTQFDFYLFRVSIIRQRDLHCKSACLPAWLRQNWQQMEIHFFQISTQAIMFQCSQQLWILSSLFLSLLFWLRCDFLSASFCWLFQLFNLKGKGKRSPRWASFWCKWHCSGGSSHTASDIISLPLPACLLYQNQPAPESESQQLQSKKRENPRLMMIVI